MTIFIYHSPFQDFIKGLVRQKRSIGYKYGSCERLLYKFDQFSIAYGSTQPILSKDLMNAWLEKRPNEAQGINMDQPFSFHNLRQQAGTINSMKVPLQMLYWIVSFTILMKS
jgi:hypothetical protein